MRIELVGNRYSEGYLDHIRQTKARTNHGRVPPKHKIRNLPEARRSIPVGRQEAGHTFQNPLKTYLQFVKARYGGHLAKLMREAVYEALDEAEALKEALTQAQRRTTQRRPLGKPIRKRMGHNQGRHTKASLPNKSRRNNRHSKTDWRKLSIRSR